MVAFISPKDGRNILPQVLNAQYKLLAIMTQKLRILHIFPRNASFLSEATYKQYAFLVYLTHGKNYIVLPGHCFGGTVSRIVEFIFQNLKKYARVLAV